MSTTTIEWTGKTWNPVVGCTKISPGCKNCYAKTMHGRLTLMGQPKYAEPFEVVRPYPAHLAEPLGWKKPTTIFVNSMSDLFHKDVPNEYIAAVFGVMAACPQHTFQILTKRAERLPEWFAWLEANTKGRHRAPALAHHAACVLREAGVDGDVVDRAIGRMSFAHLSAWPLPNAWIGVSVEDQEHADARIPYLLQTPAAVRFLSCEPLLGPIDFRQDWERGLDGTPWEGEVERGTCAELVDWVIVGGESGPKARPFAIEWARSIVRQCREAGTSVFVKQVGAQPYVRRMNPNAPAFDDELVPVRLKSRKGSDPSEWPEDLRVREMPPR